MVKGEKVKQGDLSKYVEGWEPFCAVSSVSMLQSTVYFRRKIKPK